MKFKNCRLVDCDGDLSKRWYVYYTVKNEETGKWVRFTHWISKKSFTRSQRFEEYMSIKKRIDAKLNQGWNPMINSYRGETTLEATVEKFLKNRKGYLRQRTMATYKSHAKRFLEWAVKNRIAKLNISKFNYYLANDYMSYLTDKFKINNRTWNNHLQSMRTLFNYLLDQEYIVANPFLRIHDRKVDQSDLVALSRSELQLVSEKLPDYNHDLYVVALLVFNCFLRPQEIVRLRVRHLKNLGRILSIPGEVSKNSKNQTVVVPEKVRDQIAKMDLDYPTDWFVFSTNLRRGKREIAPTRIAGKWRKFADAHNLKKGIYALKHTGNGMALENGANARDLQLQNRHGSLDETQKYLDRFSMRPSATFADQLPSL